jgi:hypothetical protein
MAIEDIPPLTDEQLDAIAEMFFLELDQEENNDTTDTSN